MTDDNKKEPGDMEKAAEAITRAWKKADKPQVCKTVYHRLSTTETVYHDKGEAIRHAIRKTSEDTRVWLV